MKNKLILSSVVALVVACGHDNDRAASQKQYETVQEGSAAGVTSNIGGPGETLPPITGTNADTTTAFGINPNTAAQPSAVEAGTFPPPTDTPAYGGATPAPMTSAAATPAYVPPTPRAVATPQPAPRPVTQQPAPEPTTASNTETTSTEVTQTDTAPKPEHAKQEEQDEDNQSDAPATQTDTTATEEAPPPPPPAVVYSAA